MDLQLVRSRVEIGKFGNIVRAAVPISTGEVVFYLAGEIVGLPTKYTIQLDADRHVLNDDSDWDLMNHGCEPNIRIDVQSREMIAARDIAPGEELTFNYNTTEWSMTSSFACGCGSPKCAGEIRGFRFLAEEQRRDIKLLISPYIAQRWSDEAKNGRDQTAIFDIRTLRPRVHVLAPYQIVNGKPSSPEYDPPEFRKEVKGWLDPLGLSFEWHAVTIGNVAETIAAIKNQQEAGPLVVFNLCDGSEIDGYPGLSVVDALNAARLPFTGASAEFYQHTTSKVLTKELLFATGIDTPAFAAIRNGRIELDATHFPVIVKPDVSAASTGIHVDSVCRNADEVAAKVARLKAEPEFVNTEFFAESFVQGREFTVLLVEDVNEPLGLWTLPPCERVFDPRVPASERFLIFERYWDLPDPDRPIPAGDRYYWYEFAPENLSRELAMTARRAMRGVGGAGYARVDMRIDDETGTVYVLEVNAQCGLSVEDSTTVGSMLRLSGISMSDVVQRILQHGLTRF